MQRGAGACDLPKLPHESTDEGRAGMHWKGRDLRGGPRSGKTGGWRRLPKRLRAGYCRLQMPLKPELAVGGKVAGHRLGTPEGVGVGGEVYLPPFQCIPGGEGHL